MEQANLHNLAFSKENAKRPPAPIHRASTSVSEIKPTSRSSTDPSTLAAEDQPERSHFSRRLHASSLRSKALPGSKHKHHHSVRHAAKNTVQSAIDLKPPTTFENILRRDRRSPDRGSSREQQQQQQQEWDFAQQQAEAEKRHVRPEDVERLREHNEKREVELRVALTKVEELGMHSTRQLDDTYYSILEKAEMLRNTVAEMQRLADESKETREKYDQDAQVLETDIGQTLDGFGDFRQHEENIDGLVKKLSESKTKTERLNDRLEDARKRVETYEKTYRETRAKRRKRWNMVSGTLLAALVVVVALLLARNYNQSDVQLENIGRPLVEIADFVDEAARPITTRFRPSPSEDPVLESMFDRVMET